MAGKVLEGVKVCDFTRVVTGPRTTELLAAHGATVVRIEASPRHIELLRANAPHKDGKPGVNRSGYWAHLNANKLSITLDLDNPKGQDIAKRLVAWSDIVAENFVPGTMRKYGLDYETLKAIKPDIIMFHSSNQGQTGPLASRPGLGQHLVAYAGFEHLLGWPDRAPAQSWGGYTDHLAVPFGTVAIVAALDYRRKTGKGVHFDLSQVECGLHFLSPLILDRIVNGREAMRMGNQCTYAAPHGVYRCKGEDRWCAIAVFTDEEWQSFCNVLGNPEWTKDTKFSTLLGRKDNEEELNKLTEEWTINFTAEQVMTQMQSAGVAAGVAADGRDICEDPQLNYRKYFWKLEQEEIGLFPHMGIPFKLSKTPAELTMASANLGVHTEHVCREILGMPDEEFIEFMQAGAFD